MPNNPNQGNPMKPADKAHKAADDKAKMDKNLDKNAKKSDGSCGC